MTELLGSKGSFTGRTSELLRQKALQGENLPKWHDSMTSMIVHDDNGRKYMRIKWVKV